MGPIQVQGLLEPEQDLNLWFGPEFNEPSGRREKRSRALGRDAGTGSQPIRRRTKRHTAPFQHLTSFPNNHDSGPSGGAGVSSTEPLDTMRAQTRILTFIAIIVVISGLPWIFFGVCSKGIPLPRNSIVQKNPQLSAFIVTFIAALIQLAIIWLFQEAVRTLVKTTQATPQYDLFFIAFKNVTFPSFKLYNDSVCLSVLLLVVFVASALVTSGITALLLPINYPRSTTLNGTELDFASNNTECINWFDNNGISFKCGWKVSLTLLSRCSHH